MTTKHLAKYPLSFLLRMEANFNLKRTELAKVRDAIKLQRQSERSIQRERKQAQDMLNVFVRCIN